jgi:Prophage tail length tape measure protein
MEVAKLGLSVDTSQLEKGKAALEALVPAAQRATAAAVALAKAFLDNSRASAAVLRATEGAKKADIAAADALVKKATAALAAARADLSQAQAASAAAAENNKLSAAVASIAAGNAKQASASQAAAAGTTAQGNAAIVAAGKLNRLGAAANDNINRLQSTPGNIAAQFQDIGVTAAGGMNPLLIALQQGTQLSAAMQGGVGVLVAGIKQLFNMTTILTIGLVALGVALLQNINWTAVMKDITDNWRVALLAVAIGVGVYAAAIAASIFPTAALAVAEGELAVAAVAASVATKGLTLSLLASPFGPLVLAILAAGAAYLYFTRSTRQAAAATGVTTSALEKLRAVHIDNGADAAVRGANAVAAANLKEANAAYTAARANAVLRASRGASQITEFLASDGSISTGRGSSKKLSKTDGYSTRGGRVLSSYEEHLSPIVAQTVAATKEIRQLDAAFAVANRPIVSISSGIGGVGGVGRAASGRTRTESRHVPSLSASSGKTEAEKQAEDFDKMRESTEAYTRSKTAETAAIGLSEREAAMLKHQTELTNQAIQQGIPLTDARTTSITAWAAAMTDADMKLAETQKTQKVFDDIIGQNKAFKEQYDQIGMNADQMSRYKWETVWLNDALKGITDPAVIASLKLTATQFADNEIQIRNMNKELDRTRNAMDFVRDGVKGFVSDLRGGLEQGKNFFSAFGDTVLNILDKIIDKLVDVALNAALDSGGSSSGFITAIAKIGASILGGTPAPNAKGGVYGQSGSVTAFAKGGTFSNSIVSSPTLFKFAKGTGMMGEAGPEAIMPLKRGANGSLGVQVVGANDNRSSGPAAPTIHITNTYTISGSSTADMQATVRQSAEQTKDQLRREIPQVLSEYQRNGAIA